MPDDIAVQAKVVLQLLGRAGAYPRTDLFAALEGVEPERITDALSSLVSAGVVQLETGGVRTTEPVQRLDEIGLIAL
jgi:predicted transcriptional regulator